MEELINRLRNGILPDCFKLDSHTVSFESPDEFRALAEDPSSFMALVKQNTSVRATGTYVDRFHSGFLGALALALWLMEFDEDNWFEFSDAHRIIGESFKARSRISERLELRLVKGSFPPMMLDQPVILDWRESRMIFLFGELRD